MVLLAFRCVSQVGEQSKEVYVGVSMKELGSALRLNILNCFYGGMLIARMRSHL